MEYPTLLDTIMETEEFISAEEYLKRCEKGEIDPASVRMVGVDIKTGRFGGFIVKLKKPNYRLFTLPVISNLNC